ncbi:MAG TPA: hypothetical protein VMK65_12420 [Longimicrobiales bacterium]|nr:hypothetical protein [Longimicrobiales bacterium]
MIPYARRPTRFLRRLDHGGWRLKLYSIQVGPEPLDEDGVAPGLALALAGLPDPAVAEGRPGVGFCLLHRGRGADYVILCWWDRENELPMRLAVRTAEEGEWRPARGTESVCVWDLRVLAFERDAYVATLLGDPPSDAESYLEVVLEQPESARSG